MARSETPVPVRDQSLGFRERARDLIAEFDSMPVEDQDNIPATWAFWFADVLEELLDLENRENDALRGTISDLRSARDDAYGLLDRMGRRNAELQTENTKLEIQLEYEQRGRDDVTAELEQQRAENAKLSARLNSLLERGT